MAGEPAVVLLPKLNVHYCRKGNYGGLQGQNTSFHKTHFQHFSWPEVMFSELFCKLLCVVVCMLSAISSFLKKNFLWWNIVVFGVRVRVRLHLFCFQNTGMLSKKSVTWCCIMLAVKGAYNQRQISSPRISKLLLDTDVGDMNDIWGNTEYFSVLKFKNSGEVPHFIIHCKR